MTSRSRTRVPTTVPLPVSSVRRWSAVGAAVAFGLGSMASCSTAVDQVDREDVRAPSDANPTSDIARGDAAMDSGLAASDPGESDADTGVEPAPILPAGKARWSFGVGVFAAISVAQARLVNMTFNVDGTVDAVFWKWSADDDTSHRVFDPGHNCNIDTPAKTCAVNSPFGFPSPAGQSKKWSGTYAYSAPVLKIQWSFGETETWTITTPAPDMAAATLSSNSYGLTHGRGYGSNASWTYVVRASQYPRKLYPGQYVGKSSNSLVTDWQPFSPNLASTAWKTTNNPNVIHADFSSTACTGACATSRAGIRYHFATNGTSRQATYNHFCKCLPSNESYPCYGGNSHTYALMNLIGDTGVFHGWVGVEAQRTPGLSSSYKVVAMDDI